jgi:hypothetical protein
MRLSLLLGRFEYGKRGILDLTHTRLFTLKTLKRSMAAAGFEAQAIEGIVVPMPFIFGQSALSKVLLAVNRFLVRVRPQLFGFQLLFVCTARPTLRTILRAAQNSAQKKLPAITARLDDLRQSA